MLLVKTVVPCPPGWTTMVQRKRNLTKPKIPNAQTAFGVSKAQKGFRGEGGSECNLANLSPSTVLVCNEASCGFPTENIPPVPLDQRLQSVSSAAPHENNPRVQALKAPRIPTSRPMSHAHSPLSLTLCITSGNSVPPPPCSSVPP